MTGVYTVSQINNYIKNVFARDFALSNICIAGEVSNCKYHTAGHIYFTLKDEDAALNCVMFASQREGLKFKLSDGQKVEARGNISVYVKSGSYQLYIRSIRLSGQGELYERFLKLRDELKEMGMFDPMYKKPIPGYVRSIGIVTAPTGAAVRDIFNIAHRRNPYTKLYLYPALVQGEGAKDDIVKGIETLDRMDLDVLIVGRGGGSVEDLWAFNEEVVARAIFDAKTPIVSAVGHETDTTIADLVADLRAPTPSAAAELCTFEYETFREELETGSTALYTSMLEKIRKSRDCLERAKLRILRYDPSEQLAERKRRLAEYDKNARRSLNEKIKACKVRNSTFSFDIYNLTKKKLIDTRHRAELLAGRLDAYSPLKRISGGYGYLTDESARQISGIESVKEGDIIKTRLRDGSFRSKVINIERLDI